MLFAPPDCEPHWRDWTLPHYKHYFWLRPLFLGPKYSEKTPELSGNLWTVLRLWAAGCWISVSTQTFFVLFFLFCFLNRLQLLMQCKIPTVAGSSCCMSSPPVGIGPLWMKRWLPLQAPEPDVAGMRPVDQEITQKALIYRGKKRGVATLLLLMNVHTVTMYVWFVVHCDNAWSTSPYNIVSLIYWI